MCVGDRKKEVVHVNVSVSKTGTTEGKKEKKERREEYKAKGSRSTSLPAGSNQFED